SGNASSSPSRLRRPLRSRAAAYLKNFPVASPTSSPELQIPSPIPITEPRAESREPRAKSRGRLSLLTAYGLRLTAYGLRLTAYGLRLTAYGLRLRTNP